MNTIYKNLYENNVVLFDFLINGNKLFNSTTSNESSKNICLIQTIFNQKQIDFIYNKSQFGMITANMLWSHLSNNSANTSEVTVNTTADKRAAIIFCLLHEILPNNLCEDIIAQNLGMNLDMYFIQRLFYKNTKIVP